MNAENHQQRLDHHKTNIEKLMMGLPANLTKSHHKQYLAGHIDCLESLGAITTETRDELYLDYIG